MQSAVGVTRGATFFYAAAASRAWSGHAAMLPLTQLLFVQTAPLLQISDTLIHLCAQFLLQKTVKR